MSKTWLEEEKEDVGKNSAKSVKLTRTLMKLSFGDRESRMKCSKSKMSKILIFAFALIYFILDVQ